MNRIQWGVHSPFRSCYLTAFLHACHAGFRPF